MRKSFAALCVAILGCSDGIALSGDFSVRSEMAETAPLANAGPDAEILRGFPTVLRGSGSHHPEGADFGVRWEQVEGERVPLSNPEALEPTFIAPLTEQDLVFELTVDDGAFITVDRVTLKVVRRPTRVAPTVSAGPDRVIPVSADAIPGSNDANTSGLAQVWETVVVSPSPFARDRGEYDGPDVFRLTAQRDGLSSAPDYLLLRRPENAESNNVAISRQAPTSSVVAGSDVVEPGSSLVLDASGTTDANGDPFFLRWVQVRGEPSLSPLDADALRRTVIAPSRSQELVFHVFATDGRLESSPSEVRVVVRPGDRTDSIQVGAGLDLRSRPGRPVTLSAGDVIDAQSDLLSFEWLQTHGEDVPLEIDDLGNATFASPEPDVLAFALSAADGVVRSEPAVSAVTVVGDDENTAPSVFLCASTESPEPGQIVVLAARIFDPEGDSLLEPDWSAPALLGAGDMSTPSAGQTCAGGAPTFHGGPASSATITSFTFEMPDTPDPVVVAIESCDERETCATREIAFAPAE